MISRFNCPVRKSYISLLCISIFLYAYQFGSGQTLTQTISPEPVEVVVAASAVNQQIMPLRDLNAIRSSGTLRILVPRLDSLAEMNPVELELLTGFAEAENIKFEWVTVDDPDTIYERLANGEGDMIALLGKGAATDLDNGIAHTLPWAVSKQLVVGRQGVNNIKAVKDLAVRQVALKKSSTAMPLLTNLSKAHAGMELLVLPDSTDSKSIMERVSSGHYDLAVIDSLAVRDDIEFDHKLDVVIELMEDVYMTWGVRKDALFLQQALNNYLNKRHLELRVARKYRDDYERIKDRRQLRLITQKSPVNFYYDRGRFKGFEYDLVRRFAKLHDLRLDVVLANTQEQMREMLASGEGDVIAASMPEHVLSGDQGIEHTRAYSYAMPVIVGRADETLIDFRDLEGRTLLISRGSPYLETLNRIRAEGINFSIMALEMDTETLLFRVAQGIYDLAVIGSLEINAELSRQLNLKALFNITEPQALVWSVRKSNPALLSELNNFIDSEYRKGFYNVIYSRYIDKPNTRSADASLFSQIDQLSPYDEIVHKYADIYNFDWRLIIAQMYQESHFNPQAVSEAGAQGLMQLLPVTAISVGTTETHDPDSNISGGIKYMDYLRNLFEEGLAPEERTWFTLAAYNAGYSRVRRARKLAETMDLDKNQWFDNVEIAMLRLAQPYVKDGNVVRDCRCGQTVAYVREIKTLYNNYLRLTESVRSASRLNLEPEKI